MESKNRVGKMNIVSLSLERLPMTLLSEIELEKKYLSGNFVDI